MLRKAGRILLRDWRMNRNRRRFRGISLPAPESGTVAIVRPDLIGDFVLATPALQALKTAFAGRRVTLVGHPSWAKLAHWLNERPGLLAPNGPVSERRPPLFDAFLPLDPARLVDAAAFREAAEALARFERVIYFVRSRANALDALLSVLPGEPVAWDTDTTNLRRRQIARNNRRYESLMPPPTSALEPGANAQMARMLGGALGLDMPPVADVPRWAVPPGAVREAHAAVARRLGAPLPEAYAVLAPHTSTPLKTWPLDRWRHLAEQLLAEDPSLALLIAGGPGDPAFAHGPAGRVRDLAGITALPETACLLAGARYCVAGDSAPAHLAAATGTPVVAVAGGGHPGRFLGYPAAAPGGRNILIQNPLPCFGCNWVCRYRLLSPRPAPCLEAISVDRVVDAVRSLN